MGLHQKLIRSQYKPETILVRYRNTNMTRVTAEFVTKMLINASKIKQWVTII